MSTEVSFELTGKPGRSQIINSGSLRSRATGATVLLPCTYRIGESPMRNSANLMKLGDASVKR